MDVERARLLIARVRLRGHDPVARTVRPWWWPAARYEVIVREGGVAPHLIGSKIVVTVDECACPHVVVHSFVHEAGHVQMLMVDVLVASLAVGFLEGSSWLAYIVAFLVWQFVWREVSADVYAAAHLGCGNTVRGYTHLSRKRRRGRAPNVSAGDDRVRCAP